MKIICPSNICSNTPLEGIESGSFKTCYICGIDNNDLEPNENWNTHAKMNHYLITIFEPSNQKYHDCIYQHLQQRRRILR